MSCSAPILDGPWWLAANQPRELCGRSARDRERRPGSRQAAVHARRGSGILAGCTRYLESVIPLQPSRCPRRVTMRASDARLRGFVLTWAVALAIWRFGHIEQRWDVAAVKASADASD